MNNFLVQAEKKTQFINSLFYIPQVETSAGKGKMNGWFSMRNAIKRYCI